MNSLTKSRKRKQAANRDGSIHIERSLLSPRETGQDTEITAALLAGKKNFTKNRLQAAQQWLLENGYPLEDILKKYTSLLKKSYTKPRASDHLKALENMLYIHGVDLKKKEQVIIPQLNTDDQDEQQLTVRLIEITTRTQRYLKQLGAPSQSPKE